MVKDKNRSTLQIEILEVIDTAQREGYTNNYILAALRMAWERVDDRQRRKNFIDKEELL